MPKQTKFDEDARKKIQAGVTQLARIVGTTLGPSGKQVLMEKYGSPVITKDGVSVAREVDLEDPFENMGAQLAKQVASKTNDEVGDGTTSSSVLAAAMVNHGAKLVAAGHNAANIKKGMEAAVKAVIKNIEDISVQIRDEKEIAQVGTISSNGDTAIGDLICEAMNKVGNQGIITLENGKGINTELYISTGYQFDRGYLASHFATNEKLESVLEDTLVLICERPINNLQVILPILNACHEAHPGKPLFIIAEDVSGDALPTLCVNHLKNAFRSCVVKAPGFGDRRKEMLEDIAVLVGATVVSEEVGHRIENFDVSWLGHAKRITTTKTNSTIVEGSGSEENLNLRIQKIRSAIEMADSDWDRERHEERLAKLVGGVAVISVGGATEAEVKEKRDRVEDALNATKAAVKEGVVPGGGVALLRASENLDVDDFSDELKDGVKIIKIAIRAPFQQIIKNTGKDPAFYEIKVVADDNPNFGYNAATETFEDLLETGVIDPTMVVRVALQNAVSIAGLVLTTDCVMINVPDPKEDKTA